MGGLGCGCSVVAAGLALVTALPFLGWGNWIFTVPVAFLAILFSFLGLSRGEEPAIPALGLIAGVVILAWSLFRLAIGGGVL